jgi:hypothetical protein
VNPELSVHVKSTCDVSGLIILASWGVQLVWLALFTKSNVNALPLIVNLPANWLGRRLVVVE